MGKSKVPNTIVELLTSQDIQAVLDNFRQHDQAGARGAVLIAIDKDDALSVRTAGLTDVEILGVFQLAARMIGREQDDNTEAD